MSGMYQPFGEVEVRFVGRCWVYFITPTGSEIRLMGQCETKPGHLGMMRFPTHGKPRPELWLVTYDPTAGPVPEVYYR